MDLTILSRTPPKKDRQLNYYDIIYYTLVYIHHLIRIESIYQFPFPIDILQGHIYLFVIAVMRGNIYLFA
jgi:hypothetical protein